MRNLIFYPCRKPENHETAESAYVVSVIRSKFWREDDCELNT